MVIQLFLFFTSVPRSELNVFNKFSIVFVFDTFCSDDLIGLILSLVSFNCGICDCGLYFLLSSILKAELLKKKKGESKSSLDKKQTNTKNTVKKTSTTNISLEYSRL